MREGNRESMNFINFTNHPVATWKEEQIQAAEKYGPIMEISFPAVDAEADEKQISQMADDAVEKIIKTDPAAVLCQGEFTLAYAVISRLKSCNVKVVAACSKRMAEETDDGRKIVTFCFEKFREYV